MDPTARIAKLGGPDVWWYNAETQSFVCRLCSTSCPRIRPSCMKRHIYTKKHEYQLKIQGRAIKEVIPSDQASTMVKELTKMLVACDIPLETADNPKFRAFIFKYCDEEVPDSKTLARIVENDGKNVDDTELPTAGIEFGVEFQLFDGFFGSLLK